MTEGKSTTTAAAKTAVTKAVLAKAADEAKKTGEEKTVDKVAITVQGITIHVWKDMLDDLELLEDLIAIDEGNNRASISALKRVLGSEYNLVKDALRDERGIVKTKDVGAFFFSVLDEVRGKNL